MTAFHIAMGVSGVAGLGVLAMNVVHLFQPRLFASPSARIAKIAAHIVLGALVLVLAVIMHLMTADSALVKIDNIPISPDMQRKAVEHKALTDRITELEAAKAALIASSPQKSTSNLVASSPLLVAPETTEDEVVEGRVETDQGRVQSAEERRAEIQAAIDEVERLLSAAKARRDAVMQECLTMAASITGTTAGVNDALVQRCLAAPPSSLSSSDDARECMRQAQITTGTEAKIGDPLVAQCLRSKNPVERDDAASFFDMSQTQDTQYLFSSSEEA